MRVKIESEKAFIVKKFAYIYSQELQYNSRKQSVSFFIV